MHGVIKNSARCHIFIIICSFSFRSNERVEGVEAQEVKSEIQSQNEANVGELLQSNLEPVTVSQN